MKSILVTGGSGFIGANFIRYVLEETDFSGTITNVDSLTYAGNPLNLADLAENKPEQYQFVKADIRDRNALGEILDQNHIDTICHFAAESHVDRSILSPDDFIQTNIIGTYNLLELARARAGQISLLHHVSTDEVFGSLGETGFFVEETPYQPNSPYSASKASSAHLVRAYHHTYGLPVTISNCSNNYGPYQFPEKLIPLMILNALEGRPLPVYGDGTNVRDWLYVRDHCTAIWAIMRSRNFGETYNVGGRNEMKNIDVVQIICDAVDALATPLSCQQSRRELITYVKDRPGHDKRYAIDCAKIERELKWIPEETFDSGLKKTVEWYLNNTAWTEAVRSGEYQNWVARQYGSEEQP